jgi:hypothetical protein
MNRQEFVDLLGIISLRGVPAEMICPSELERPFTKNTLEFEIAQYLGADRLNQATLQGQNATVVSAWSRGIMLLLDEDSTAGKTFAFLYLSSEINPSLEVWTNHDEDPLLPVWRFTEKALAELTHPKIAAEYMALVSADAEDKRLRQEAERAAILERGRKAKIARLAELKAEMEDLESKIREEQNQCK